MAVHFQWVEIFVDIAFQLLAAGNPPLGFDIQAQQLVTHALERGFHFVEGELGVIDLLLDASTDDRMLTGQVAQVVQQFGIDLDHVPRHALGGYCRTFAGGSFDRAGAGRAVGQPCAAEVADVIDQRRGGVQRLPQAHRIEHVRQAVVAVLQQREQGPARWQAPCREQLVQKFQFMGQVTDGADFDHACHPFEGVQVAHQVVHLHRAARVGLPSRQRCSGALDDVRAFFEENLHQLFPGAFRSL